MNKNSNLYDYCWNIRDPWWVLLRKTVPGYYLRTILVNLPFLALLLGSLGGPEMAKIQWKLTKMNKSSSLYDYCWKIRDPWWVQLPETVPGYYPRTTLVNLSVSELLLGSL